MRIISTEVRFMFILGCHLSLSGGYAAMGQTAVSIGANTFQYFTKNPRGGVSKPADPEDVRALCAFMKENGILFPLAHAPYIYNPATADERIREYTLSMMKSELEFLEVDPRLSLQLSPGRSRQGGQRGRMPSDRRMSEYAPHGGYGNNGSHRDDERQGNGNRRYV